MATSKSSILDSIFKYRWFIGSVLIVLAVLFEINGSSIGMWNRIVPDSEFIDDGILLGEDRPIRSDEWAIFTPMAFSQYYNGFKIKNDILRASDTDVFITYGQPIWDWSMIFRPFQIGFLFLNSAKGLSYYWVSKFIVLFLVSLEFGLLITDKDRLLAVAYAVLVTLAPVVQWWFSINAFPDMLVYGQGIILCLSRYIETNSYKRRILFALGLYLLCGAYLLVMYPAWQVPFFYIFASIGIWVFISHKGYFLFQLGKDVTILIVLILAIGITMFYIFSRSWDAIHLVINSSYPGNRLETGGTGLKLLFQYVGDLFLPFIDKNVPASACERAVFFDLSPIGLIISLVVCLHRSQDRKDYLILLLWLNLALLGSFVVIGFPRFLAKTTLLSISPPYRAIVALSYVNLLLLIRSISCAKKSGFQIHNKSRIIIALLLAIIISTFEYHTLYATYFSKTMLCICITVLFIMILFSLSSVKLFSAGAIVLSVIIGITVNPIRSGIAIVEENDLGMKIQELAYNNNKEKWLVVSDYWFMGDFPIMYGARTINSINTYINNDLWDILDPSREYEKCYNRYANINFDLVIGEPTSVELLWEQLALVRLNVAQLIDLGVEYIISEKDLSIYESEELAIEEVFSNPKWTIYQIVEPQYNSYSKPKRIPDLPIMKMITAEEYGTWIGNGGIWIDHVNGAPTTIDNNSIHIKKSPAMLTLSGWAIDFNSTLPFKELYLNVGDKVIRCAYGYSREDIQELYLADSLLPTGFSVSFPRQLLNDEICQEISFIGISEDGKQMTVPIRFILNCSST